MQSLSLTLKMNHICTYFSKLKSVERRAFISPKKMLRPITSQDLCNVYAWLYVFSLFALNVEFFYSNAHALCKRDRKIFITFFFISWRRDGYYSLHLSDLLGWIVVVFLLVWSFIASFFQSLFLFFHLIFQKL